MIKNRMIAPETLAVLSFLMRSQAIRDGERPSTRSGVAVVS